MNNAVLATLVIGGGLLLLGNSARRSPLSGDDAADALRILKAKGAPPELLGYLAKHPALLREYMKTGTVNGRAPRQDSAAAGRLNDVLAAAKKALDALKAKSGKTTGGGGGGGGGGGKPKGGAAGRPSAPGTLGNPPTTPGMTREQVAAAIEPAVTNEANFRKEVDLQFQAGNLTAEQYDALVGEASATGNYDLGAVGAAVYDTANEAFSLGEISAEQFNAILLGEMTLDYANYENLWDAIGVDQQSDDFDWDAIAEGMGWDTQPSTELEPLVESWMGSEDGEWDWDSFWEDWNAGEYDYDNEIVIEDDAGAIDWEEDMPWLDDWSDLGWEDDSFYTDAGFDSDWNDFWNDYDAGYYDADFGWTDDGYSDDYDYDYVDRNPDRRIAVGNPIVAAPAIGGLALFAIAAVTILPELVRAFKGGSKRRK